MILASSLPDNHPEHGRAPEVAARAGVLGPDPGQAGPGPALVVELQREPLHAAGEEDEELLLCHAEAGTDAAAEGEGHGALVRAEAARRGVQEAGGVE